jgi:hypothetical protein
MKFLVKKSGSTLSARRIPDSADPQLLGAARLFIGEAEPTAEQMAALFAVAPRTITKLTLKERFDALGKWEAFKAVLTSLGLWDDFILAQDIRTDHPLFIAHAAALKVALELTDEQFATLTA